MKLRKGKDGTGQKKRKNKIPPGLAQWIAAIASAVRAILAILEWLRR